MSFIELPAGWTLEHSRTHKRPYYYHAGTGKVTWDLPSSSTESHHQQLTSSATPSSSTQVPSKSSAKIFMTRSQLDAEDLNSTGRLSQVSTSVGSEFTDHLHPPSESWAKDFRCTGENSEDLSSTGKLSLYGGGDVSSTKSPDSVARASSPNSGEGGVSSTKSPDSAARASSPNSGEGVSKSPDSIARASSPSIAGSCVIDDSQVPETVLQLVEELECYKTAASRIDELKLLLSDMELERWALEAALESEEEDRLVLEDQLACLDIKILVKTTALKEAQRNFAKSECFLAKVVQAKRAPLCPSSGSSRSSRSSRSKASESEAVSDEAPRMLEIQTLSLEFLKMREQLSNLDAQLQKRCTEAVALASTVGYCKTGTFAMPSSLRCANGGL